VVDRRLVVSIGVAVLICVGRIAAAGDIPEYKLQMQTSPKIPGKHRIIEGQAGPQPDRFVLEGLGVLQPVAVTVIAKNKGDEITVAIGQDRWEEAVQKLTTSADKPEVTTKFRTQGDVEISVTAATEPRPYWLIVWVGDAVDPQAQLAPVVVPMSKYKREHPEAAKASGGTSPVMVVIAVALVAIVLLLAVMAFRKRGKS
jgi:hypothetical protein